MLKNIFFMFLGVALLVTIIVFLTQKEKYYDNNELLRNDLLNNYVEDSDILPSDPCYLSFTPSDSYKQQSNNNNCGMDARKGKIGIYTKSNSLLTNNGDWMVILKPGIGEGCTLDKIDGSYNNYNYTYGYMDSSNTTENFTFIKEPIADVNSPVTQTLMGCNSNGTGYIAWNDQAQVKPRFPYGGTFMGGSTVYNCWKEVSKENFTNTVPTWPNDLGSCVAELNNGKKCYSLDAHDKGFIIFDKDGGVYCNSSCPQWPFGTGGDIPASFPAELIANLYNKNMDEGSGMSSANGQQLCFIYLSSENLDKALTLALSTAQVGIQDSFIDPSLEEVYPNLTKLMQTVFMQVPSDPTKVQCLPNKNELCKNAGQDGCENVIWNKSDGGCDYPACDYQKGRGCLAGVMACKGMNQSWTVWENIPSPVSNEWPWSLDSYKGSGDTYLTFDASSDIKILAKSGYLLANQGNADIFADVLAPIMNSNVIGSTWDSQYGPTYTSPSTNFTGTDFSWFHTTNCGKINNKNCACSTNIEAYTPRPPYGMDSDCYKCMRNKTLGDSCSYYNDHSKMAISSTGNWSAFGGLNRHDPCATDISHCPQCCRGTTFILIDNQNLHTALVNLFNLDKNLIDNFAKTGVVN